ncbi:uncharacterized protein MONBRDRAFT_38827 [Monosiga brevicollis MX1]|uniref:TIR domain-containing protein n=1 Tax=Monosiga brevicollis TaxID=81824 RepID=A9VAD9_MONBE|nr:uncharacterized protein MONBRDRAFT_38827 [Monosiga brevicollis MX1]EDQ85468.1 predicted protein [Monosiga brevicollis MX1]|eukprot:XP_001749659.1 hypothetical protein [Monosiga brevicollis MX1]
MATSPAAPQHEAGGSPRLAFATGTRMVVTDTFQSTNVDKCSYTKGDLYELVEDGELHEQYWRARPCVHPRPAESSPGIPAAGKINTDHIEVLLDAEDVAAFTPRIQAFANRFLQVTKLSDEHDGASPSATLPPASTSTPACNGELEWRTLACLVKQPFALTILATMQDTLLPLIATTLNWDKAIPETVLAILCLARLVRDNNAAAKRLLECYPTVTQECQRLALWHDVGPSSELDEGYDKITRKLATNCAKLLDALLTTDSHSVIPVQNLLDVVTRVLGHKDNNIHRLGGDALSYHLPAYLGILTTLAQRPGDLAHLRQDSRVLATVSAIQPSTDGAIAADLATGLRLLLAAGSAGVRAAGANDSGGATPASSQPTHIMISYNWRHQPLALKLAQTLQAHRFRVWIDVHKMEGNIMSEMASAVENAAVVLMLYSKAYAQSRHCMLEAQYVFQQQKSYIPVFVEPGCERITGVLGIMRGTLLYEDLSSPELVDQGLQSIIRRLGQQGRAITATSEQSDTLVTISAVDEPGPVSVGPGESSPLGGDTTSGASTGQTAAVAPSTFLARLARLEEEVRAQAARLDHLETRQAQWCRLL